MFADGLHNRVDIRLLNRNFSNRAAKDDIKISDEPDRQNVPCRIIRDEKVMFAGELLLPDGSELLDLDSGRVYEVRASSPAGISGKRVRGLKTVHHSAYEIRLQKIRKTEGGELNNG